MEISNFTIVNADTEMKPKTKLQKMVVECSEKLPPLSAYQEKQAINEVAPHLAKHNSKNEYVCLDCGHSWKGKRSTTIVCPHCGRELTVDTSRQSRYYVKDYFALITKRNGLQVVRMFLMSTTLCKGEKANYWIKEAFQRWIAPNGQNVIISRRRHFMARYCDSFDYFSEMSLKMEVAGHMVAPYKIIGKVSVIPEIKRNGFDGDFHKISPYRLFTALLQNNKIETLWKMKQRDLVEYSIKSYTYPLDEHWPSIKIALRHHYVIRDPSMWFDYLRFLKYLDKDIRNPQLIFPQDLVQAHDTWHSKYQAKQERELRERRERNQMSFEQRYFNSKDYPKDEQQYERLKSKFFGLAFTEGDMVVKPLTNIKEFADEARLMHHCVFSNKYFNKENALIFHAMVDGVSVATIEFNLETLEIIQCRGPHNSRPALYDRITELIKGHINEIIAKKSLKDIQNHDREHTDCA